MNAETLHNKCLLLEIQNCKMMLEHIEKYYNKYYTTLDKVFATLGDDYIIHPLNQESSQRMSTWIKQAESKRVMAEAYLIEEINNK